MNVVTGPKGTHFAFAVSTETRSLIGPVLGGGFGAAALIVLLIVVVVFANRRWTNRTKGNLVAF